MKIFIVFVFILVYSLSDCAQDSVISKIKEYHLTFTDFSPVTLQLKYKRQVSREIYFKIGLVSLMVSKNSQVLQYSNFPTENFSHSAGLEFGSEFRKHLNKKISLYHGPSLSFIYQKTISRQQDPAIIVNQQKTVAQTYRCSIPYSLGIILNLNSNILITAEVNPTINYNYHEYKSNVPLNSNTISQNINIGLDNRLVLLSIAYRL
ncbi:MAG: hypothetical protein JNJ41_02325 [Bacteroidia bacterium]|nr:hypothetical protein [Bacteroidia bacterium]